MLRSVLVTGASSGIGEATALHLARKGFRDWAGARRLEKLKPLEAMAEGRIHAVPLDVLDRSSIEAAVKAASREGPLFGLVNNAGVSVTGPVEEVPVEDWRRQFETNVFGVVSTIQAVLPMMRAAGSGRIVNIGSVAGRLASPFMGAYAASKHALEGMTDSLRRETADFGVKVSLVRPGFINTPFGEQEQDGLEHYARTSLAYGDAIARFKAWHARGHPTGASPNDVAEAVHHAMTAERPNSRYTVPARYLGPLMMRNLLPSAVVDRVFARVVGVKG